jgi:hypothetical protein
MSIIRLRSVFVTLLGVCLAALSGCSATPRFNDQFGVAARANLSAQVLAPLGGTNADPTLGIDGAAARATQERYQRSFKETDAAADQPLVGRTQ